MTDAPSASSGQAALLALLFVRWRLALGDGLLGVDQFFAGHRQRNTRRPIPSNGQRLAPAIETVIVAEGDGTGGRYHYVHAVAVRSLLRLVRLGLKLESQSQHSLPDQRAERVLVRQLVVTVKVWCVLRGSMAPSCAACNPRRLPACGPRKNRTCAGRASRQPPGTEIDTETIANLVWVTPIRRSS